ncbi:MAG TPA: SET domain-containing protein, partial [Balneola sp.]|nr:SET domain-containing protein [Balneola sp.]
MMSYRPLPEFLYIGNSPIDGHGLFTDQSLEAGIILGISHVA